MEAAKIVSAFRFTSSRLYFQVFLSRGKKMDIALFSPSSLFDDGDDDGTETRDGEENPRQQAYLERTHVFPGGLELCIREYSFHQLNANLLWPGTFAFCDWLLQHSHCLKESRILELGSGTGSLAIFLRKLFEVDVNTSDFDDAEIEENISYNCRANGLEVLPHIRHTWGEPFPVKHPDWDMIIASDILLYVKQYPNLIKSLSFLLKAYKPKNIQQGGRKSFHDSRSIKISGVDTMLPQPTFLMSWRRRIGQDDEKLFFKGCEDAGLAVEHLGSRIYSISPGKGSPV